MSERIEGLADESTKRIVAILNSKIEIGRLMNALGHMAAGLAGGFADREALCFLQYKDRDGGIHPNVSHFPFIILKADNSNQLRKARKEALLRNIPFTDFTHTMIVGTSRAQLDATLEKPEEELEYFGLCLFGDTAELREITKKFSLFKAS